MSATALCDLVLSRHGGLQRWKSVRYLEVDFSSGGLAFSTKFQGHALIDLKARIYPDRQTLVLSPFPKPGLIGEFDRGDVRILTETGVTVRERLNARSHCEISGIPSGDIRGLEVTFPTDFHTHSPINRFYFDGDGLLLRHHYTAEIISSLARAANLCDHYRSFNGFPIATRRRVFPELTAHKNLSFPLLVWIDIREVRVTYDATTSEPKQTNP